MSNTNMSIINTGHRVAFTSSINGKTWFVLGDIGRMSVGNGREKSYVILKDGSKICTDSEEEYAHVLNLWVGLGNG